MTAYIALARKEHASDFGVDFPDFPGCVTAAQTLERARDPSRVIRTRGAFPGRHPGSGAARLGPAEVQPDTRKGAANHGDARFHPTSTARSRRPLRPPHPPLEPAHVAVHLRRPQPGP